MTDISYECEKCGNEGFELFNNSVDNMGIFHHRKCENCGFNHDDGYRSEWWLEEQKTK